VIFALNTIACRRIKHWKPLPQFNYWSCSSVVLLCVTFLPLYVLPLRTIMLPFPLLVHEYRWNELQICRALLPLPMPDEQGRCLILMRNGVYPPETNIADVFKVNMMILDVLFEENDQLVICGSANVMDHAKNTLAHMVQMSPAIVKKITTVFQVTFAEPPLATNYPKHCIVFKGTVKCTEGIA